MQGCRPLTDAEIRDVCRAFHGEHAARDRALFLLGVATGFRISELLALRVGDVWQYGRVTERVTVSRRHMKRKTAGRTVLLNALAREALAAWLAELARRAPLEPETMLFKSRKGANRAISRQMADKLLRDACAVCEISGPVATHSMRKTFARKVYRALDGDLVNTRTALGHQDVNATIRYLAADADAVDRAVADIRLDDE